MITTLLIFNIIGLTFVLIFTIFSLNNLRKTQKKLRQLERKSEIIFSNGFINNKK